MFDDLDRRAFAILELLEARGMPEGTSERPLKVGEEPIIDLGEIHDLKFTKTDPYGTTLSCFKAIDAGKMVGLPEEKYSRFAELVGEIQEMTPFSTKATFSFLESHAFDWIMETYESKQASQNLTNYLLTEIDKEYRDYHFIFKLEPLVLDTSFRIGETEIGHLTQEFIAQQEEKFLLLNKPRKEFDDMFKHFGNSAVIQISKKGVRDRAAELAIQHGELVSDVLKCFLHDYSVYGQYVMPDIDHRKYSKKPSAYLYHHDSTKFSFAASISNEGPVVPVEINDKILHEFKNQKIDLFGKFIDNRKDNEFYNASLDAITLFSDITSTLNKYDKIVKLISFFETMLIDKRDKRGKGETIMKNKLMPKLLTSASDVNLGIELTSYFYRIRDAYLHNGVDKHVDYKKLYQFQTIAFRFLKFIIKSSEKYTTLDDFYEMLNK